MILCPNCHHQEIAGALFCSECGAQLISTDNLSTQSLFRSPSDTLAANAAVLSEKKPPAPAETAGSANSVISIHLMESGQVLHLTGRTEFTIGRIADGQPILPDVDLSPYEAYSQGVSRLHAALKFVNQRWVLTDLGSSNGSRVNGQKIMAHIDYPLNHGDVIALGKLKIQILIRS